MTEMEPGQGPLRVAITSLGCKVNFAEMADLAGRLAASGCDVVAEEEPADVRVVNSCTVTVQADATTRQKLSRLRRLDPGAHLVLTGCSVDTNQQFYETASADNGHSWADAIFSNAKKGELAEYVISLAPAVSMRASASPRLRSRAFLKVQDGCNHRCTYCIVWKARGASRSRHRDDILAEVEHLLEEGYKEIVLCGVDLGAYGRGTGCRLPGLVSAILQAAGTSARLRLSSINANDVTEELIALNTHPQLCPHWHMPLQSGSDAVLKSMHRGYRRRQYLRVAQELRQADPSTEFTTDIMVAFPGETDSDHRETLDLVDEVGFAQAHVFRYSPRPATPAALMPARIPDAIARRRSAEVRAATARTASAARLRALGATWSAIWDGLRNGRAHGLTETYQEVWTEPTPSIRPGGLDRVIVDGLTESGLHATVVNR